MRPGFDLRYARMLAATIEPRTAQQIAEHVGCSLYTVWPCDGLLRGAGIVGAVEVASAGAKSRMVPDLAAGRGSNAGPGPTPRVSSEAARASAAAGGAAAGRTRRADDGARRSLCVCVRDARAGAAMRLAAAQRRMGPAAAQPAHVGGRLRLRSGRSTGRGRRSPEGAIRPRISGRTTSGARRTEGPCHSSNPRAAASVANRHRHHLRAQRGITSEKFLVGWTPTSWGARTSAARWRAQGG